jgi:4-cresol dehydrogenase (hydroxylating)
LVKRALAGKVDKLQFLSDRLLQVATRFARAFGMITGWDLSKTLDLARPIFGLMKGIPTDKPMASVYWRKRNPPPAQADPDRDGCGLLWCAPVAPTGGAHAQKLASLTSEIVLRHGFEPTLSITLITERALICVISAYDRHVEGEDRRARVCFDELQSTFAANGYMPYRLGIQSMGQMQLSGAYGDLLASIKRSVDPANILAPGRYAPVALGDARTEQETPSRTTPTPAS